MRWLLICMITVFLNNCADGSLLVKVPAEEKVLQVHGGAVQELHAERWYRLLVWNVLKGTRPGLMDDLRWLSREADLVLLQESLLGGAMYDFFTEHESIEWTTAVSYENWDNKATGVTIGSRWPPVWRSFTRSKVREPLIKTPKMIVYNRFVITGHEHDLLVANIHGINFVSATSFASQLNQMSDVVAHHLGPLIVAGDFNTYNNARWDHLYGFADQHELELVEFSDDQRFLRLDSILVRGIRVEDGKILSQVDTSDHRPLTVRFFIPAD
jgi:endonuclease/exonuclease/phosphatase (EEP) superfamily protein YafD